MLPVKPDWIAFHSRILFVLPTLSSSLTALQLRQNFQKNFIHLVELISRQGVRTKRGRKQVL